MEMYIHLNEIHNNKSAKEILPLLFKIFFPQSVIDVGCGIGTWLKVCEELGVREILGIDGEYVDSSKLYISRDKFKAHDLKKPFNINKKFDLVICLEVAEHISPENADDFITQITKLGDVILFSAAIPDQGGQGHVNEQWPAYWQNKFDSHGFVYYDIFRPRIWNNDSIDWWYKQNIFLIVNNKLKTKLDIVPTKEILNYIHPILYQAKISIIKRFKTKYRFRAPFYDQMDFEPLNTREAFDIFIDTIRDNFKKRR